jgi:hypothetical protein
VLPVYIPYVRLQQVQGYMYGTVLLLVKFKEKDGKRGWTCKTLYLSRLEISFEGIDAGRVRRGISSHQFAVR